MLRTGPLSATITCLDLACYRRMIARERGELRRSGIRTGFLASLRTTPWGSSKRRRGYLASLECSSTHQAYHPFLAGMGLGIDARVLLEPGFSFSLRCEPLRGGPSVRRAGGLLTIKMPSWQSYYLIYLFWKLNVSCEGGKAYGILAIFFPDFIKGLVAGFAFKILLMV